MDETPFPDGNVGGAVRVGDTVRRPTGPWTAAVHSLLNFLGDAGLDGIPRVVGIDDVGREVLTFLPGHGVDTEAEIVSDAVLAQAVRWLRRYHDTVSQYRPEGVIAWRNGTRALAASEIICHHDPGVYNWIVSDAAFVGMVDWDMAGPGRPLDDLAFMAWTAVPLISEVPVRDAARRLRLMADTYGGVSALSIVRHADVRMTRACETIAAGQRRGDPGMLNLAKIGEPANTRASIERLRERMPAIVATMSS